MTIGTPANSLRVMTATVIGEVGPRTQPPVPVLLPETNAPPETNAGEGVRTVGEATDVMAPGVRGAPEAETDRSVGATEVAARVDTGNVAMTARMTVRMPAVMTDVKIDVVRVVATAGRTAGSGPVGGVGRNAEMSAARAVAMTGVTTGAMTVEAVIGMTAATTGGGTPRVLARQVRALGKAANGGSLAGRSETGAVRILATGGNRAGGTSVGRNGSVGGTGRVGRATGRIAETIAGTTAVKTAGTLGATTGATVSVVELGRSEEPRVVSATMSSASLGWSPPRWTATSPARNWIARPNIRSGPWNRSMPRRCPSTW